MVEPDFTPLPVYNSMKQYITTQKPVLYAGVHQAGDWRIKLSSLATGAGAAGSQFPSVMATSSADFDIHGTDAYIRWGGGLNHDRNLIVSTDDNQFTLNLDMATPTNDGWYEASIYHSTIPETKHFHISYKPGFLLDSITVLDRTVQNILPIAASLIGVFVISLYVVISAWRERRK